MHPTFRPRLYALLLAGFLAGAACAAPGIEPPESAPGPALHPSATSTATVAHAAVASTQTPAPDLSPTPDPYAGLTIADLASRAYGGGELEVYDTVQVAFNFSRSFFRHPSDGLTVHGFMNVPSGDGPFPVVLVLHGYVDPARYQILTYTTGYANELARAGFLVLHPNYRNHPPSDGGANPFRVGYAVDVLNLIALVRQQGGLPGPLEKADPAAIGLLGHSMGGGIALRTITVDADVDAAVLYGSMSGDERRNFEKILEWSGGADGLEELSTPDDDLIRISPLHHVERIEAAVSIHHGDLDSVVPPEWSTELCSRLESLGALVECFSYSGQPHTFVGAGEALFLERVIAFFNQNLNAP